MTASGRKFWPTDPHPDDICIEDIADGLSRTCRFAGQLVVEGIYTVAQHSVLGAKQLPHHLRFEFLLHDAAEGYIHDIARPTKYEMPDYLRMEKVISECIQEKFHLRHPHDPAIKEMDNRMWVTEASQIMHPNFFQFHRADTLCGDNTSHWPKPLDIKIIPWDQSLAKENFLAMFESLTADNY